MAALGTWLLLSVAIAGGTALALRGLVPPGRWSPILVAEVYTLLLLSLVAVLRPHFLAAVALRPCSVSDVVLAAIACGAAYLLTWVLQAALAPQSWRAALAILRGMGSDDGRLASAGPLLAGLILTRACVLAPIGEELLFRGALFTWLRQRWSAPTTLVLTAAGFAAIHGFLPILPLAFALGLGFGWIRERSGSTVPAIALHALHNLIMVSLSYAVTGWTARLPSWSTS